MTSARQNPWRNPSCSTQVTCCQRNLWNVSIHVRTCPWQIDPRALVLVVCRILQCPCLLIQEENAEVHMSEFIIIVFYAVFAHVHSTWSPFGVFFRILPCLCFFMRNEAQGAHSWLEIYPVSKFQSDWCTECSASLAEEKKETKKNMKNPMFYTLSSSPSYACLITLFIVLSSSNGAPKRLYTLRMPERVRLAKFWRVCCFGLM